MGSVASRFATLAALISAGMTILTGCERKGAVEISSAPPTVTVSKPIVRQITDYFEFPGQTEAVSEVAIRARVTGYIVKLSFEDGQDVKRGQVLFEIDPRPYQAALEQARGEVARIEAIEDRARADLKRSERLRKSNVVSAEEYEQRVADLKIAKASIASAKAAVTEAELNLEFTKIISPIDGRVSRARIREGNLVQSGNDSPVLTTVVTTDPIYVAFNLDEHALLEYQTLFLRAGRELHPGRLKDLKLPVEIGLMTETGFPHKGILNFADNKIDHGTGTMQVRGEFQNKTEYLTPGMFVRVRIPFGEPHQALLVDESAIGTDQRIKFLLVVKKKMVEKKEEHVVERRNVQLGRLHDGLRVIEAGIKPDDLVIVKGLQRARPGDVVVPHFDGEKSAATSSTGGIRGQSPFAGTARRVLRTNGDCPLFPAPPANR
jgi:RND family efflux transporter MFP subunit